MLWKKKKKLFIDSENVRTVTRFFSPKVDEILAISSQMWGFQGHNAGREI